MDPATLLPDDVELFQELVRQDQSTIDGLQRRIVQLEHQLARLLRQSYGPSRERLDARQLLLFETETNTEGESPLGGESGRQATKNGQPNRRGHGRGRPSIDPEVYCRMELVAYLYDIKSDRGLCEQVRYNLAYRWFS